MSDIISPIEVCESWLKRPQSFLPRLLALDLLAEAMCLDVRTKEQARAIAPDLILYPPERAGEDYAISRGLLSGNSGTCVAYAPTRGECWALAFLEVAGGR